MRGSKSTGTVWTDLKKTEKTSAVNIWSQYGKVSTVTLIYRHLNAHGEIIPSDIQETSCRRSVHGQCQKMVKSGELVVFKEKRFIHHANLNNNQKYLVSGFKRAWKHPNDGNRLGFGINQEARIFNHEKSK